MDKNKILILGDGLLGGYLHSTTGWDYISRKNNKIDFSDINTYDNYLPDYDIIINCIANTDTYSTDKESHWAINFKGVADLVDYCNNYNKKLVHISTDYIYSNSKEAASEQDVPVHCRTWYGYTKLLSDGYVQLRSLNYLLIRGTQKKKPFPYPTAYGRQIGNFDYVDVIGNIIIKLILANKNGIYNVGTKIKSMGDLAKETLPDVNVFYGPLYHPDMPENVSMNIDKLNNFLNK